MEMAKHMTKFILSLSSLLLLALFSSQTYAASPWATPSNNPEPQEVGQATNNDPVVNDSNARPATLDDMHEQMNHRENQAAVKPQGDIVKLPQNTEAQAASIRILDFPRRGMSVEKVENELGRPIEIISAVGQPPITRWVYNDRTVYFEYASVIHVVAK